jgi:hypothetical protein
VGLLGSVLKTLDTVADGLETEESEESENSGELGSVNEAPWRVSNGVQTARRSVGRRWSRSKRTCGEGVGDGVLIRVKGRGVRGGCDVAELGGVDACGSKM